jgi:DNA-binding PadR family transcriptional regulator
MARHQRDRVMGDSDVMQGTLDMLILKSLSLVPMHGFGISLKAETTGWQRRTAAVARLLEAE